jgi:hypothetical protein
MRDSRIRVLLHPKLEPHEAKAAVEAAERFSKYGLRAESITEPRENLWKDLCRKNVYDVIFGEGPISLHGYEPLGRPAFYCHVPHDGALLAGLTPHKIFHSTDGKRVELEGFNMHYVGAVVSAFHFKPSGDNPYRKGGPAGPAEASEAITLSLMHELGHALLGREQVQALFGAKDKPKRYDEDGHCLTSGCLMQNVADYVALARSAAAQRIEFCEGCADQIGGRVSELRYYAMA